MPLVTLADRRLIALTGADAESLLQNVITADLDALRAGEVRPGALLSPQGKILFDFLISRHPEGGFLIDVAAAMAADLVRRLTLYRLRAKVEIALLEDRRVVAVWGDDGPDGALTDLRFVGGEKVLRSYPVRPHGESLTEEGSNDAYTLLRIRAGVAELGPDYDANAAFPHDVLFDRNAGVSFRKGCFVGQEVVSRMQHRGTARRRTVIVSAPADLAVPRGTPVEAAGRPAGELGSMVGGEALAIVRTDRVAEALAAGAPVTVGGQPVQVALPAWSGLDLSGPDLSGPAAEAEGA